MPSPNCSARDPKPEPVPAAPACRRKRDRQTGILATSCLPLSRSLLVMVWLIGIVADHRSPDVGRRRSTRWPLTPRIRSRRRSSLAGLFVHRVPTAKFFVTFAPVPPFRHSLLAGIALGLALGCRRPRAMHSSRPGFRTGLDRSRINRDRAPHPGDAWGWADRRCTLFQSRGRRVFLLRGLAPARDRQALRGIVAAPPSAVIVASHSLFMGLHLSTAGLAQPD